MDKTETVKIQMPREVVTGKITYDDGENTQAAACKLTHAFNWEKSEEGREFWSSVYKRLKQIATRGY